MQTWKALARVVTFALFASVSLVACQGGSGLQALSGANSELDGSVATAGDASADADASGPVCAPATPLPALVAAPQPTGLVVHEWGTFTSMQDPQGKTLDGMHHEDEALPGFVHGRRVDAPISKSIETLPEEVNQKMETPVLYFHTPKAQSLDVTVDFPKGIISQWFPRAESFLPPIDQVPHLQGGQMHWKVDVDPALGMAEAPAVADNSIWRPSRQTTAAPLRVGGEVERLIFYRGLGRFVLPVTVTSNEQGAVTVRNDGDLTIPQALLLWVGEDGRGSVQALGPIAAGGGQRLAQPAPPECTSYLENAQALLRTALLDAGLHDDEARAMIDTWRHSYWMTPGVRILYVLPQPWTETLLPLQVKPEPQKTVRVLVGRIEVLRQTDLDALEARLAGWYNQWNQGLGWQGAAPLLTTDRFLESKLRALQPRLTDVNLQGFVDSLISELDLLQVVQPVTP